MTNRMDNMTTDERREVSRPSRKNYIIEQCCSVEDLRSHLHNHTPSNAHEKVQLMEDLYEAEVHESQKGQRVTIIKMLHAKYMAVSKLNFVFIIVILSSCAKRQVIVWDGRDIVGLIIFGVLLLALFVLWVINYVVGIINRKSNKRR